MIDIFDKFNIQYERYKSSIMFQFEGETYTIFQNKKSNQKCNWFYFSDLFKGRNFKNFFSKVKHWFVENIGEKVIGIFKSIEKKLFEEVEDIIEETKQYHKREQKLKIKFNNTSGLKVYFYGLFDFMFNPYKTNKFRINVVKEMYEKYKDRIQKIIFEIAEKYIPFMGFSLINKNRFTLEIVKRDAFMVGHL
jgi:hypothetical protein